MEAAPKAGINDPSNLQAICDPCHRKKTLAGFVPATGKQRERGRRLWERIQSPEPLRESDDEVTWPNMWRKHAATRKALVASLG